MEKCTECLGEGLKHQGESITVVCEACKGTGKGVESMSESVASEPAGEITGEVTASESFSTESEEVGAISEGEVEVPE